jgi:hypothetical protein
MQATWGFWWRFHLLRAGSLIQVALRVQPYGDIKSLYTGLLHSGAVIIIYHDLRAATLAVHHLHRYSFKGQQLSVTFSSDSDNGRSDSSTEGENPHAPAAAGSCSCLDTVHIF